MTFGSVSDSPMQATYQGFDRTISTAVGGGTTDQRAEAARESKGVVERISEGIAAKHHQEAKAAVTENSKRVNGVLATEGSVGTRINTFA